MKYIFALVILFWFYWQEIEYNRFERPVKETKDYLNNEVVKYEGAKEAISATQDFIAAEKVVYIYSLSGP